MVHHMDKCKYDRPSKSTILFNNIIEKYTVLYRFGFTPDENTYSFEYKFSAASIGFGVNLKFE